MTKKEKLPWGSRMIKVEIKFWTNDIPKKWGKNACWNHGVVHLTSNNARGIKGEVIPFNDSTEIIPKINELLKKHEIKMVKWEGIKETSL